MLRLKVITTDCTDPYVNLAAEEHLTMSAGDGGLTLFLWQNARTVVIGKNQNPWRECDVEAMKRDGISLARRISGGGAVYHDLGNLNFTFIAKDGLFDVERQTGVILLACRLLGINASRTGRNDLVVSGRKFSGHAYWSSGGFNYHHGTIMMDVEADDLTKYLNVPASKLESKGVASVRSRVTNLSEHIPADKLAEIRGAHGLSDGAAAEDERRALIEAMKAALVRAAEREYGCGAEVREVAAEDMTAALGIPQALLDKYASDEWRLGTRIPFTKLIEHRFEWGGVEVQLSMRGGYINECRIYSDALETEGFEILEKALIKCRYDAGAVRHTELPKGTSAIISEARELIASSI